MKTAILCRLLLFTAVFSLILPLLCGYDIHGETIEYNPYMSYSDYYEKYLEYPEADSEIIINAADYTDISEDNFSVGTFCGKDNVLIWDSISGSISYDINAENSGLYSVYISYCAMESGLSECELSMSVDGSVPYDAASRIILNKTWVNNSEPSYDIYGNQIHPSLTQSEMWKTSYFTDSDGLFSEPLVIYLEKGLHTITFSSEKAYLAIEYISLKNPEKLSDYKDYAAEYADKSDNSADALIRIEGENIYSASDSVLYPTYDKNDVMCSPSNPVKTVFNTIGDEMWKKSFQSVTWEFTAENDGFYKFGIKYKQDEMRGVCTYRRIYIDGKVPFSEFDSVSFPYTSDWKLMQIYDDNSEISVYLEKGTHTITLEAIPSYTGDAMRSLDGIIDDINEYYNRIIMITGTSPDKYTDYYVHEKIPELTDKLAEFSAELKEIRQNIENLSGFKGSEAAQLEKMYIILDKCTAKPLRIPEYVPQLKDNISSLSSWSRSFREQPLEIDYIEIAAKESDFSKIKGNIFQNLAFMIKSFFGSFFNNYSILSDNKAEDTLEVWVCLGRDQTQIVKELADSDFYDKYGINVNVNLVQGTILEACMTGKSPDAALFLNNEFPLNLAVRDLTVCLSDFEDYDEVAERFTDNADLQYTWNDGVYALPVSQSWAMMFYRKDILYSLGINSPPETWDNLVDILPALQRNHMSAGLVLPYTDISAATETGHTYAALLLQNGIPYYNQERTASSFDDTRALQLFEFWTELYTKYGLEQSYDAFSRFRTGEYPVLIADYSFANQLYAAAPEINGLWEFTDIPGTVQPDGSVCHAVNSTLNAGVIFKDSEYKENAWLFLKWFTSEEIQTEYSRRIEGISGKMGRFTPSNTAALENMSWSGNELERLIHQRNQIEEIPVIPASYSVTRNIMNAFRESVNNGSNPYSTLMIYNNDINAEITRKSGKLRRVAAANFQYYVYFAVEP